MFYNRQDQQGFQDSERAGLKAAADSAVATAAFARAGWCRADADGQRSMHENDSGNDALTLVKRERFRTAHREAMELRDEVAELDDDSYGDMDEYGYAA